MQLSSLFHVKYRRFLFTVNDSFMDSAARPDADINYYIQSPENVSGTLQEFYTLLIDLKQPQEEIRKGIYHRTQTEILSFYE